MHTCIHWLNKRVRSITLESKDQLNIYKHYSNESPVQETQRAILITTRERDHIEKREKNLHKCWVMQSWALTQVMHALSPSAKRFKRSFECNETGFNGLRSLQQSGPVSRRNNGHSTQTSSESNHHKTDRREIRKVENAHTKGNIGKKRV